MSFNDRLEVTLLNRSPVAYPEGGGHLSVRLQYILGLQALGHRVNWIAALPSSDDPAWDRKRIAIFLRRLRQVGLEGRAAVLHFDPTEGPSLDTGPVCGMERSRLLELVARTDLALNICHSFPRSFLQRFARTALLDLDPAHLQIGGAPTGSIDLHDRYFTVGLNMHADDCEAPYLNRRWQPFLPPMYLPMWTSSSPPPRDAALTSITQWTWRSLKWQGELVSVSKRDAYLRYVEIPSRCAVPFELAANIGAKDPASDRRLLTKHGWRLSEPHRVARNPARYRRYVHASLGEFGCAKPIHARLRTGWFSDRTAVYLACGRPAVVEETGVTGHVPTGRGLLTFADIAGAEHAANEVGRHWQRHSLAAREFAEEFLDHRKVLPKLIEHCFSSDDVESVATYSPV